MEVEGRRQQRLRLHLPHVGHQVREQKPKAQLREIVADGIASFKIFLAYKNFFGVDDGEMYQTLKLAKTTGRDRHRALRERRTGRRACSKSSWRKARPAPNGMSRAARNRSKPRAPTGSRLFSKTPAAAGYVVHLSCEGALHAALAAKARGVKICVESVLPHFLLDKTLRRTARR